MNNCQVCSKNSDSESHLFAFYFSQTTQLILQKTAQNSYVLDDDALVHRMVHVLRLQEGQQFILFDQQHSVVCQLESISSKYVRHSIISSSCNVKHKPDITVLLPVLKKEALHEALYSVVELGASDVQLVTTKKGNHAWGGAKELERLNRIMQSAAEQSKNFAYPTLAGPCELVDILASTSKQSHKIFFDPDGCSAHSLVASIYSDNLSKILMFVGPAGDLICDEKKLLDDYGFVFCKLTPTILRSQQAVALGLGLLRALLRA